jgi:hypothetical protein
VSGDRSGGRGRVVRSRRPPDPLPAALAGIDRRLLDVLCAHRVVTQAHLGRLFPDVPERTLRYRTRRLHDLGLVGRSRPYRERGSAPNHHWPTRRADCLMRGEPAPRGGERARPNPAFLAHAAALTGLFVALRTEADPTGLRLQGYRREGEAREPFTNAGKGRALAPDAMIVLTDARERKYGAFVEIDLGSMSHARLRQKAELYAAYVAADAWRGQHLFLPALLFLTTTDARARKFLKALARALAYGPRLSGRRAFVAGAGGLAWEPDRLLGDACLTDLDGTVGLTLTDVLSTARTPYERALAYQREQEEADEARRQVLRDDPEAMRKLLYDRSHVLAPYVRALGETGERAVELLCAATSQLSMGEREALRAIARDLGETLPEPRAHELPSPGAGVRSEIAMLVEHYRATQAQQVAGLAERYGDCPCLQRARKLLRDGGLLDQATFGELSLDAERDAAGRREQHERREAYLLWREHAARQLARRAGPLGRLTHRPQDFYAQLDRETLRECGRCGQTIYPCERAAHRSPPSCHFCREPHSTRPYEPTPATQAESEADS